MQAVIPVTLHYHDQKLDYAALIDSGADFCIFDAELGAYLGLDIEAGEQIAFGGVQDTMPTVAYLHELEIEIGGNRYATTIGFSYAIAEHGYGLLGQKGFFDVFTIKFDLLKEEIEIKERPARS